MKSSKPLSWFLSCGLVILTVGAGGGRRLSSVSDLHPDVEILILSGSLILSSLCGVEVVSSVLKRLFDSC